MDNTLEGLSNTYAFSDDFLIVTKGTVMDHWAQVRNVLERLDSMNIRLKPDQNKKWKPIHFASRFLSELEDKYTINELE